MPNLNKEPTLYLNARTCGREKERRVEGGRTFFKKLKSLKIKDCNHFTQINWDNDHYVSSNTHIRTTKHMRSVNNIYAKCNTSSTQHDSIFGLVNLSAFWLNPHLRKVKTATNYWSSIPQVFEFLNSSIQDQVYFQHFH